MHQRTKNCAVVFFGATFGGLCAWFLLAGQPLEESSSQLSSSNEFFQSDESPQTLAEVCGTAIPVVTIEEGRDQLKRPQPAEKSGTIKPTAAARPSAGRSTDKTVRLPSIDATPQTLRPAPVVATEQPERLPAVCGESAPPPSHNSPQAATDPTWSGDPPASKSRSLASPYGALADESAPEQPADASGLAPVPEQETAGGLQPIQPGLEEYLPGEPALIAPGVSGQYEHRSIPLPAGIGLPPGAATAKAQSRIAAAVAQQADLEIRRGMELAQRRAVYSAREAITEALRMIAEAQDAATNSTQHGRSLAAGLRALDESDGFIASQGELEADLNVAAIITAHRTPVLRGQALDSMAPLAARRIYYTYAQEQLSASVDHEPMGSMALFALGRLHGVLAEQKSVILPGAESKAIVFHQAAMLVCPENPLAANELGVLLARAGRYEEARDWLVHSAKLSPLPATWHNLAVVHRHLGESKLSAAAAEEARVANKGRPIVSSAQQRPKVEWVAPGDFAAKNQELPDNAPAPPAAPASVAPRGRSAAAAPAPAAAKQIPRK